MTSQGILSISDLNNYIKKKFDSDEKLLSVWVKGEISNFSNHYKTGHLYFSLKDDKGLIRAVMFSFNAKSLRFEPNNGMMVIAHGRVSVFERDGQYQLYVDDMQPDGVGALYIAYNQLKSKLEEEGLFDPKYKKEIPKIPLSIGVITSPTGAAVRDIINVLGRRFPLAKVNLYPVLVQGAGAVPQLIEGVEFFNKRKNVDVIIIARGGGSIEDLWAFNSEELARVIFASKIPIISGVGHETDFTITDFVADLRAPTPSAAAEICVPDSVALMQSFNNLKHKIYILVLNELKRKKQLVNSYKENKVLKSPKFYLDDRRMTLLYLSKALQNNAERIVKDAGHSLKVAAGKLNSLSPLAVLSRGFSYTVDEKGSLIKSINNVKENQIIKTYLNDGTFLANVKEVIKNKNGGC